MSDNNIKITSGKDLNLFLKILAEESVNRAYSSLNEQDDPLPGKISKKL